MTKTSTRILLCSVFSALLLVGIVYLATLAGSPTPLVAHANPNLSAGLPQGSQPFQVTPTATPGCCYLTANITTSCSYNPSAQTYTISFNADVLNSCGMPDNTSYNFYLMVSSDGVNYTFIRRTTITTFEFPPGHTFLNDVFSDVTIPPEDIYYRIDMQIYNCGIYRLTSPASLLCGVAGTGTPSPTTPIPSPTYTPTFPPVPSATRTTLPPTGTSIATYTSTSTSTQMPTYTTTPAFTATPGCASDWEIVSSPNPNASLNVLYGVSAVSSTDVWAVGSYAGNTMTLHWNGGQWIHVPSPNRPTEDHFLAVTAIASNDVWAVGFSHDPNTGWFTLTEHWDGSQWSIISSPNPQNSVENYLRGVSANASNDVWAVGYHSTPSAYQSLILHWNGSQWSIVSSPNVGMYNNELYGVEAYSSSDAWAVGAAGLNPTLTLVQHWDGTQWSVVSSPNPPGSNNDFAFDVESISETDAWLVGSYQSVAGISGTLVEHWDGTQWSIVPSPDLDQGANTLYGVAAISTDDVWAVGYFVENYGATIIEHWDGTQWSIVPSPNPANNDNILEAVAAVSSDDIWAVGWWDTCLGCPVLTLTEHYSVQCPSPSPTSSPSPTTSASSATITATVGTPTVATPTSTTCPIQFSDVPPGSTFYSFIRCLACRGIINGYSGGTFRPNANVTRGQLAKIVSNAAGFSDPPGNQLFQDVPPGSTFFDYIQRLANINVMTGYTCGGPGEPCVPPNNLNYFRPNANATRGQISKIVSNAAGFGGPTGDQLFEDVPPSHVFYFFVQQLASRGIMQGYSCGGPGEPCVSPGNRSYFRPGNNATRGQISKIVSNTFFPGCLTP